MNVSRTSCFRLVFGTWLCCYIFFQAIDAQDDLLNTKNELSRLDNELQHARVRLAELEVEHAEVSTVITIQLHEEWRFEHLNTGISIYKCKVLILYTIANVFFFLNDVTVSKAFEKYYTLTSELIGIVLK